MPMRLPGVQLPPTSMKLSLKAFLILSCFISFASCKKDEHPVLNSVEGGGAADSKSATTSPAKTTGSHQQAAHKSQLANAEGTGVKVWLGRILRTEDEELFEQWTQDLSRSANERLHREQQLAHLRRAEVLTWNLSDQDLKPLEAGAEPREVSFPFFANETLAVVAEEIRRYGEQSIYLQGHLADEPESKVYLNLSNKAPVATIEGPNTLYYYEAFEGVAILREDEPGSQHEDFNCNCESHQAARGE